MTKTEARSLEAVCPALGEAYGHWKDWEAQKNLHKEEFFELATRAVKAEGLAEKVASYPGLDADEAETRAARHNPGWTIIERRPYPEQAGQYEFILREDPALKAFSFEFEGVKFARQVSRGAVLVDEEWLGEEDVDLYHEITIALPWGERILIPLDRLKAQSLSRLAKYIYNDKPRVQLAAPRPVKEES